MIFKTYFKAMESSLPLYAYAETRLGDQLERYRLNGVEGNLTFAVEAGQNIASCHLIGDHGFELAAEARDRTSMYAAVDILADKIDAQLRRSKEKRHAHRVRTTIGELPIPPQQPASSTAIDAADILSFERTRRTTHH